MGRSSYFEQGKWDKSKLLRIKTVIKGMIQDVSVKLEVVLPSGKFVCVDGNSESIDDICIREEWVGGVIGYIKTYELTPDYDTNLLYFLELSMSQYIPYYGVINDCKYGVVEYYNTYDELIDAIMRIKDGKKPYSYTVAFAEGVGLPVEDAVDCYSDTE